MKAKKKPRGIKQKIREEKESERRILLRVITAAILIATISISGFIVNSMLNQSSTSQTVNQTEPRAAIVDHLSLTYPNQTFIQTATNTLKQVGYTVDYYLGEQVTVEFYRNLATHGYRLIILRVHSSAAALTGKDYVECPVGFFTSELYSKKEHVYEQLTDQLMIGAYSMPEPPYYFAILPKFVTTSMKGQFQNTIVVMMGCEGLNNTKMAEALVGRGAKVYIGWSKSVSASHTDQATTYLLQQLIAEKQTIKQAVDNTMKDVGPDMDNSLLIYYPLSVGDQTIEDAPANKTNP